MTMQDIVNAVSDRQREITKLDWQISRTRSPEKRKMLEKEKTLAERDIEQLYADMDEDREEEL